MMDGEVGKGHRENSFLLVVPAFPKSLSLVFQCTRSTTTLSFELLITNATLEVHYYARLMAIGTVGTVKFTKQINYEFPYLLRFWEIIIFTLFTTRHKKQMMI